MAATATSTSLPPWTTPRARSSRPSWSRKKAPSRLSGLRETIEKKGLFCAFYTDFPQPQGRRQGDKGRLTQVVVQLGIEHIPSYSPEARGRIERLFTLQGRLPQELRLAGIAAMDEANRYIAETFLPAFNDRFSVPAAGAGSAFLPYVGRALADILAIQDGRQVQNDNTVRYKGVLQSPSRPTGDTRQGQRQGPRISRRQPRHLPYRAASRATTRRESCPGAQPTRGRLNPLGAPARGPACLGLTRDGRYAKPGYPQASSQRSGHLMCYKNRTSLCVIDRHVTFFTPASGAHFLGPLRVDLGFMGPFAYINQIDIIYTIDRLHR